jgi:hypothetical protein
MAMEHDEARELISKYFEGQTSEDEERLLKDFLHSKSLPESLMEEYGYIAGMNVEIPEPSEGFDARLEEITHLTVAIKPSRRRGAWITGIGAAAALAAGIWIISDVPGKQHVRDTFDDPLIAMAEVKSILLDVSERMNTGTTQLEQVGEITNRPYEFKGFTDINELVERNLSRLRYLGDLK